MTIDTTAIANWAIAIAEAHWMDLLPIVIGTLAGLCLTCGLELFIPITWPVRQQKGITWAATVVLSWGLSTLLWGAIDATDSLSQRSIWSLSCSAIAVFLYPAVGRWATKRWPSVASVWAAA